MRQSREELIKRGVLKEIYDKGKGPGLPFMGQKAVHGVCAPISQSWMQFSASLYQGLKL